jgi:hypothetical protein
LPIIVDKHFCKCKSNFIYGVELIFH